MKKNHDMEVIIQHLLWWYKIFLKLTLPKGIITPLELINLTTCLCYFFFNLLKSSEWLAYFFFFFFMINVHCKKKRQSKKWMKIRKVFFGGVFSNKLLGKGKELHTVLEMSLASSSCSSCKKWWMSFFILSLAVLTKIDSVNSSI